MVGWWWSGDAVGGGQAVGWWFAEQGREFRGQRTAGVHNLFMLTFPPLVGSHEDCARRGAGLSPLYRLGSAVE